MTNTNANDGLDSLSTQSPLVCGWDDGMVDINKTTHNGDGWDINKTTLNFWDVNSFIHIFFNCKRTILVFFHKIIINLSYIYYLINFYFYLLAY